MVIPRTLWWLPRPSKSKYPGSVPLHFEKKFFDLYPADDNDILQPFGGKGIRGIKLDIKEDVNPDFVGDAHDLPFPDNRFDVVFCDPPYSNEEAKSIYGTPKLKRNTWINEAVRVTKPGGIIAIYHKLLIPRPKGCSWDRVISIITRVNHQPRVCAVFKKDDI